MSLGAFYEFFAGGGMVRAGLGSSWECRFSNDFDPKKGASYVLNWGRDAFKLGDVRNVSAHDLPGLADLAWASFPCQDLSLAGAGAGLKGERSGTFWPFWDVILDLKDNGRAPRIVALENVCGALTSHAGKDFAAICSALQAAGYRFGALVVDAALFLPQSRPRLFVIGIRQDVEIPYDLLGYGPSALWHSGALVDAQAKLSAECKRDWIWWNLPPAPVRNTKFIDVLEDNPSDVAWHSRAQTEALLAMMSPVNLAKVEAAQKSGEMRAGTIYRRTRRDDRGEKVQRAEVRFDDIAGCLRTPSGGSSRQFIIVVEGARVRSRLISSRETARLMGLPESYALPAKYNDSYHLTGDGVAVPVVRFLADKVFERLLPSGKIDKKAA